MPQTIGLSSGKLAYYLRAGLPAIVNRAASIGPTLETAGCGVAVEAATGVGQALAHIEAHYADYSTAACRFFEEQLDSRRAFQDVLHRIDALAVSV